MKPNEFHPLPDEFNLGYRPPVKHEEEKEKKRRQLRKLILYAAVVLFVLPFTLRTGIFSEAGGNSKPDPGQNENNPGGEIIPGENDPEKEVPVLPEGTYYSGGTYVCFSRGKGWFFNGEYFIPMEYDTEKMTYRAAGAYPESEGMGLVSTVHYISCEGDVEMLRHDVRLYDPFRQKTAVFMPTEMPFDTMYIIRAFSAVQTERYIAGTWTGAYTPDGSIPMAYLKSMTLDAAGGLQITVGNTENEYTQVYAGSWSLEDGVLKTSFSLPLKYEIVTDERTITCTFEQMPEGILFYTQRGYHLYLNIFSSQLFTH